MCVMCYKANEAKLPTAEHIMKMWERNPDGAGIMWIRDDGMVGWKKGFMSRKSLMRYVRRNDEYLMNRHVAFHFRITTHGGTCPGNTHPFVVGMDENPHKLEGVAETVLMHNGILSVTPRVNTISDSAELALRAGCYENPLFFFSCIDEFLEGSKILVFDKDGPHFYGDAFRKEGDLVYSNLYHLYDFGMYQYGAHRCRNGYSAFDSPEGGSWNLDADKKTADGHRSVKGLSQSDKDYLDQCQMENECRYGW